MPLTLHTWTSAYKEALMALCNAVDRTVLSDRLPYPYTEAVQQTCGIAFGELGLGRITATVFERNGQMQNPVFKSKIMNT